jgi:hypothetical protein
VVAGIIVISVWVFLIFQPHPRWRVGIGTEQDSTFVRSVLVWARRRVGGVEVLTGLAEKPMRGPVFVLVLNGAVDTILADRTVA